MVVVVGIVQVVVVGIDLEDTKVDIGLVVGINLVGIVLVVHLGLDRIGLVGIGLVVGIDLVVGIVLVVGIDLVDTDLVDMHLELLHRGVLQQPSHVLQHGYNCHRGDPHLDNT